MDTSKPIKRMCSWPYRVFFLPVMFSAFLIAGLTGHGTNGIAEGANRTAKFGDWTFSCVEDKTGQEQCAISEVIMNKKPGGRMLGLTVRILPGVQDPRMVVLAPLGLDVQKGMTLGVDKGKEVRMPIQTCDGSGCITNLSLADGFTNILRKGNKIYIGFWPYNSKKRLRIEASLTGFSQSLAALEAASR